jgi:glucan biosynthesis protein C
MTHPGKTIERYHALDSLRASMMLVGVWLHTVVGYSRVGGWYYKDAHSTAVYDWTVALIHTSRMPVFFVMAGFFGALLWQRGKLRFAQNRVERILIPFLLFWTWMFPVVMWMAAYAKSWDYADGVSRATRFITSGSFLQYLHPLHMWFLEYLMILYAFAFAIVGSLELAVRLPWLAARFADLNGIYRAILGTAWRPLVFAVPSAGALMLLPGALFEDPPGFRPVWRLALAYAIPFFFGWLLYYNRDLLSTFRRHAWAQTILAGAVFGIWMIFVAPVQGRPEYWFWLMPVLAVLGALILWLLVFGLTGLFLRYCSRERRSARYFADASYWMYVMHMPVVMFFQMALARLAWPAAVKVPLVVIVSFLLLAISYDVLVRATWVGVLLNGRRYPRWFSGVRQDRRPHAGTSPASSIASAELPVS